jgi:hypothetical protein
MPYSIRWLNLGYFPVPSNPIPALCLRLDQHTVTIGESTWIYIFQSFTSTFKPLNGR